jgi:hypothetical protein
LHVSELSKYRANDGRGSWSEQNRRFVDLGVRAEPVAAGDSTTCGGLHGRRRVKLYQGVSAALNSELLHAVHEGPGLQPQPDRRALASFDDPINLAQYVEDVFALDRIEVVAGTRGDRCTLDRRLLDWQHRGMLLNAEEIGIDT